MRTGVLLNWAVFVLLALAVRVSAQEKFFGNIWKASDDSFFGTLFSQITPENAGKWGSLEPSNDNYLWSSLDNMYDVAENKRLKTKQHCFVWGQQQPGWVDNGNAQSAVEDLISDYFSRYGAKIDMVDVVNEPLHAPPSYMDGLGGSGSTGWDWVIWVFEKAKYYRDIHAPDAKLLLNDYDILNNSFNAGNYVTIIQLLNDRGLIDGIGVQGHFLEGTSGTYVASRLDQLAVFGLPIYVSEFDVHIADDQAQLLKYQDLFPVMWEHTSVGGVTLWGLREGQIWRQDAYLVRSDGSERPALTWLTNYFDSTGTVTDADADDIVDAWEVEHFGDTASCAAGADADGDGYNNLSEFVAGTDPHNSSDALVILIEGQGTDIKVLFSTKSASGIGYDGFERFYTLEQTGNLLGGLWQAVSGKTALPGRDGTAIYTNAYPDDVRSFRVRTRLE